MGKKNKTRQRNHVVKNMIQRSQKAGYHTDQKKERDKYLAREPIDEEEIEEPFHERELDEPEEDEF